MSEKTVLGFDFGLKKIGLAIGESITGKARPLALLKATQGVPDWTLVKKIIQEWGPNYLLVGAPYDREGGEQPILIAAKQFSDRLKQHFHLPVEMIDERYTSQSARSLVKTLHQDKHSVDSMAALLIVEDWLRLHKT